MRKNCARKWLHLVIDLLPILIIPIFAIWEINHKENENITVEVENRQVVNFNQKIKNGDFVNNSNWRTNSDGAVNTVVDNVWYQTFNRAPSYSYQTGIIQNFDSNAYLLVGHKYFLSYDFCSNQTGLAISALVSYYDSSTTITDVDTWYSKQRIYDVTNTSNRNLFLVYCSNGNLIQADTYIAFRNIYLVDLTVMFGVGNEPTSVNTFLTMYPLPYYDYTTGIKQLNQQDIYF